MMTLVICGCEKNAPALTKAGKPDPNMAPLADKVIFVEKDGVPLVLADMLPEAEKLVGFPENVQQEYLRIRAKKMVALHEKAQGRPVKVRMILVRDRNECGNPDWAGAMELAVFEVASDASLQIEEERFFLETLVRKR